MLGPILSCVFEVPCAEVSINGCNLYFGEDQWGRLLSLKIQNSKIPPNPLAKKKMMKTRIIIAISLTSFQARTLNNIM